MREETPRQFLNIGRLFEAVRDAVVVADTSGRIILWNPGATKVFGYTAEEAIGRDVAMLVPEALRPAHRAGIERFREQGKGPLIDSGAILELPSFRRDGTPIVVEMTLSRIEGHVMAILREVTDRVRLREEVERERASLREANETLESFAYVVGHDLKQPVRAVDAYLEELAEHPLGDEARRLLEEARAANGRMAALLTGLIDWSRASLAGPELRPMDVPAILRSSACSSRYERLLSERRAELVLGDGFEPVLGTEGLLCQLFGNIVLNAIEHNPRRPPRVEVQAVGREGDHLVVTVRDNGPGFSPDVLRRVSGPLADKPDVAGGGFGMVIARRAAKALGGRLQLWNPPEGGAEVRIWLRRAASARAADRS